jgi:hypothetical protein
MDNKLTKKYGLLTAVCMVVGIVIGSGVFFKAQTILTKTGGNMPLGHSGMDHWRYHHDGMCAGILTDGTAL